MMTFLPFLSTLILCAYVEETLVKENIVEYDWLYYRYYIV